MCYDLKYALRLCSECNHQQACIHIYATMGLYEEAVDLALQVNFEDKPIGNILLKLYIRISFCNILQIILIIS